MPDMIFKEDWLHDSGAPNPNMVLQCMLTQLANYTAGAVSLLRKGLDNPARANCRLVQELTLQIAAVMFSQEDFRAYIKGQDEESSAKVWNALFARGRLIKKIEEIERSLSFDDDLIREISKSRADSYKYYSQAVHNSFIACTVGAYSKSFSGEEMSLAVMGAENETITSTLKYLNQTLWYFLLLFFAIIQKHHKIMPRVTEDSLWMEAYMLYFCVRKGYQEVYHAGAS